MDEHRSYAIRGVALAGLNEVGEAFVTFYMY